MSWVDTLVHDTLLDWRDQEGRLLGEQASRGYDTAEQDTAVCPFAGSRHGEPFNAGAWKQVLAHHTQVCRALQLASGPTAGDAWLATCRLRWAPLFSPRPPTALQAACFKTALGLNRPLTSWLLLSPGAAARPLDELVAVQELVPRLEAEGWLHGSNQVCAAPPRFLESSWESLVGERRSEDPADAAAIVTAGLWALLGRVRSLIRAGVLHEIPGWSPVLPPDPDWPLAAQMLSALGPGALVREVPRFEPEWALHCFAEPPETLLELVRDCRNAEQLSGLDDSWQRFLISL